ncbi:trimeric intracellular cation channel family protein [Agromyces sp. LHK192]|uniref:trimeric intracellular cation channel family protein n=1 Tax=Agromyces sp. LHK192 TaxID=2498704 RepID=UPI000FDB060B|nr:TRIC cation channel family protein [Agromyces sp. LHK192]
MSITTFQVALWVELLAAGLGGLQGALFAADTRHRRIDVLGVLVIGLIVALGGSLLRDVVLNQPPVVIWMNWYLVVAGGSALIGMTLQPLIAHAGWLITLLDAVVMGLFGAIGATKALSLGVGEVGALVVGVVGAIGGGMLRDIVLSIPVSFLRVGTLYAVAAGSGVGVLVLLVEFGVAVLIASTICVAVTTVVRVAAVVFDWKFPEQRSLHRPRRRSPA